LRFIALGNDACDPGLNLLLHGAIHRVRSRRRLLVFSDAKCI
jgi:hypothetical protein